MKTSIALLLVLVGALSACGGGSAPAAARAASDDSPSINVLAAVASTAPSTVLSAAPLPAPTTAPSATASSFVFAFVPGAGPTPPPATAIADEDAAPPPSTNQKGLLHAQLLGTEIVFVTVTDANSTCASLRSEKPAKGDRRMEIRVPWQTGYYDFSGRSSTARFEQYAGSFWQKANATQGGVRVRAAPTAEGSTGVMHLKAQRPGESVDVELAVTLCTAVDPNPRKGKK